MILKPFKVHSPDGKTFYEGEAPQSAPVPRDGDEQAYDGDSEESRAAFRAYDERVFVHSRSSWQIWRDACAWQAALASNKAAAVEETHPTPISIRTDQIAEIAGKYNLGNPRLDALRGFVNEVIIVNGAEYAKSE